MIAATVTRSAADVKRTQRTGMTSPQLVIVTLAAIGYAVSCVAPVVLGFTFLFDRYLLPIIPLVAILTLHSSGPTVATTRRARIAGCTTLAALAALGAVYGANSASFDGAKWRVARQGIALARDPKLVDAGHTWNDYQAGKHLRGPLKGACIVLRAESHPTAGEVGVVGLGSVWDMTGTQVWIVAHQSRPC